jgi:hypothetical protein
MRLEPRSLETESYDELRDYRAFMKRLGKSGP